MDKKFTINPQIGSSKHSLSYHNDKLNKDGSGFWDLRIFKNKNSLKKFVDQLKSEGYKEV